MEFTPLVAPPTPDAEEPLAEGAPPQTEATPTMVVEELEGPTCNVANAMVRVVFLEY